jgi:ABC-type transport system involved in cytochrome bd biosynthesis fused ATPase/permease subunit
LKFAFGVPMSIKLKKGERLILISKPQAGKSTFFQMLIGNLHILSGMVKFSGSIGYLPQNLWFRKTSMRDNVLFGLPLIKKKLNFVYTMVLLKEELGFFRNGDKIIMEQNNGMSDGQRRRIALARVLYAEPDLLLLDEVFASIDPETTHAIYNNLCKHYSDKTIVLSTHVTNFVRSEDKLMILKDGVVMQFGTLEELSTTSPDPQRNIL